MSLRRSLKFPIVLAVVMIVMLIALTVGWVWVTVTGALSHDGSAAFYWTVLPLGTTFLVLVLVGVVLYLTLSIKAINLTRRQSNFIDAVTHELKSPIASLKLYLQTLGMRQVSDEQKESFCRFMLEDVERLDHLINHVLDAGRIEKPVVEEEIESVRLDEVIEAAAKTVCMRYQAPGSTVRLRLSPCTIRAQRLDVEMIFRNLIDNAVKYADSKPEVNISLEVNTESVAVAKFQDNGPGIPQKMRRKLYGRFERLGLELERKKPGTGLGLYIVRTLVRRLKGRVRVSDAPGGGSVFEVTLPRATPLDESPSEIEPIHVEAPSL